VKKQRFSLQVLIENKRCASFFITHSRVLALKLLASLNLDAGFRGSKIRPFMYVKICARPTLYKNFKLYQTSVEMFKILTFCYPFFILIELFAMLGTYGNKVILVHVNKVKILLFTITRDVFPTPGAPRMTTLISGSWTSSSNLGLGPTLPSQKPPGPSPGWMMELRPPSPPSKIKKIGLCYLCFWNSYSISNACENAWGNLRWY